MTSQPVGIRSYNPYCVSLLGVAIAALAVWLASFVPNADWTGTYQQVGSLLLHGRSPNEAPGFLNPPWAAVLVLPFAVVPGHMGRGALLVASLPDIVYTAWRLHAPWLAAVALLVSLTTIGALLAANLDCLLILGAFLPQPGAS